MQQAGGLGMLLLNTSANSINADFHFVPTVHLQDTYRTAVKAYAATGGRHGGNQCRDAGVQRGGAIHRIVLVARPAAAPATVTC